MVIVNPNKAKECYALYDKMVDFNNTKFMEYTKEVKLTFSLLQKYRSNFYCSLCDIHQQKFFMVQEQQIIMAEGFCSNVLQEQEPTIKYLNVIFIEYMDVMIRMINCYDSSADPAM